MTPLEFSGWQHPETGQRVQIFRDEQSAVNHIRDHVLTQPENSCWGLVFGALFEGIDLESGDSCYEIMKRIKAKDQGILSRVYRAYAMAIELSLDDAWDRQWCARTWNAWINLSIVGLGIPFDREVLSAAFLGQSTAESVRNTRDREAEGVLFPRDEGQTRRQVRWSREGRGDAKRTREDRVKRRIRDGWSREELIYHEIYNIAIKHIRKLPVPPLHERGAFLPRHQFGILRPILARAGGLKLELDDWLHEFSIFEARMRGMLEKAE